MAGKTRWLVGVLALLAVNDRAASESGKPSTAMLGKRIDDFRLADLEGRRWSLQALAGKRATVLVFLSFECPVSAGYSEPLNDLARKFQEKGVAVIGIVPGANNKAAEVAKQAGEYKVAFRVLLDPKFDAVSAVAAEFTPEAFLLDQDLVLRYRGRIDDAYARRLKNNSKISRHDLQQALVDLLGGRRIAVSATQPVGCPIQRESAAAVEDGKVSYYRDVLPILQRRCQSCHRPDGIGPFSLMNHGQAVRWAADIKEFTKSRQMPPWKPLPGQEFHQQRRLSDKEIATLAAWVDAGKPAGNSADAPHTEPVQKSWPLGRPDVELTVPGPFHLGPSGADTFRYFVVPSELLKDSFVVAIDVKPGAPRVVRGVMLFADRSGRTLDEQARQRTKKGQDYGAGFTTRDDMGLPMTGFLGSWTPGQEPFVLQDAGYFLPAGADVVMKIHYHRSGRPEADTTTVGLYLAKKPVRRVWNWIISGPDCHIPAGEKNFPVETSITSRRDCQVVSIMPHLAGLGREMKITVSGKKPGTLLAINDWDSGWQQNYILKRPLALAAGTRVTLDAIYDNSAQNPSNPNRPPRAAVVGMEDNGERALAILGLIFPEAAPVGLPK